MAGIFIVLTAAILSGIGAIAGSLIGDSARRVIRSLNRDNPAESQERQPGPFIKVHLANMRLDNGTRQRLPRVDKI